MTRAELRAYFKELLNRSDCTDIQADQFINLGIRRLERILRVPTMERRIVYTSSGDGVYPIPNDYLELIGLFHANRRLERVTSSDAFLRPDSGDPAVFWREGPNYIVRPKPASGEEVVLIYYGEFEELGDEGYETFESAVYPDAIIYSALTFAADFFIDERKPLFVDSLSQALTEIQASAEKDALAGHDMRLSSPYSGLDY